MAIEAELFNGTILEFPDGTDPSVIQSVVKRETAKIEGNKLGDRTWGEAATDVGASLVSGVGQLAQLPGQIGQLAGFYKPEEAESGLQGIGRQLEKYGQEAKSGVLKGKELARAQKVAAEEGMAGEFYTAIKETIKDPALFTSFFAEQIPNLIGSFGGGMLTKGAVKLALRGATETALEKAAVKGAVGTGAAMQGADIGSDTYEQTYNRLIKEGMDPSQANETALSAARQAAIEAAAISVGTAYLPGGTTIEKALVGRNLPRAGSAIKGMLGETLAEGVEEGGGKFVSNLAMHGVFPDVSLTKGVGEAAGMGALMGGVFGGMGGATLRGQPEVQPELKVPEGFTPPPAAGIAPEATQTTAGAFTQPEYNVAPTLTPEAFAERQFQKYTAPALERTEQATAARAEQLAAEEIPTEPVAAPPVAPAPQPVAVQPQYTPEEIEQTELAMPAAAQPVPVRFAAEDIIKFGDPKTSANWFGKNVVNKTVDEVASLVESNPKLVEGNSPRAKILRGMLTPPSVEGTGQVPFSPAQMADVRQAQLAAEEEAPVAPVVRPQPVRPVEQATIEPLVEPTTQAEIDELEAARSAVAHPVVHAITANDVISAAPNKKASKWMTDNIVGKTQPELQEYVAKNSHLLAGNTVQAQTLRKLTQPPTNVQFPSPVTSTTKAQGRIDQTVEEANKGDEQARFRLNNLGASYSPELKEMAQSVRGELVPMMQRFGLQGVGLQLVDSINNGSADGAYFRNIIQIALDSDNPMQTLRHEVIHALKKTGAFSAAEWKLLEKKAHDEWIDRFFSPEMQEAYYQQYLTDNNGSPAGFGDYMAEEAIAEAFKYFEETKKAPAGTIGNLFRRLKEFLAGIRDFFLSKGVTNVNQAFTPEQVFSGIEQGRYRPAYGGAEVAPAYQAKQRFAKRYAQEGTKLGTQQRANDEVEHLTDGEYSVTTTPQRGVYGLYNNYTKTEEFTGSIKQVVDRVNAMVATEPARFAPFKQYSLRPTDRQYKLQIEREKRKMAKTANLTEAEQNAVLESAQKLGLSEAQVDGIIESIKNDKRRFPSAQGWADLEVAGVNQKTDEDGNPIPGTEAPMYKARAYAYNRRPGLERAPQKLDLEWRDKVADKFTGLITDIYKRAEKGDQNAKNIIAHQTWYKSVAATLRKEYGAFGDVLSDLLGATSPNTPVDTNWRFSIDVLRRFVRGDFNAEMRSFVNWLEAGKPVSQFPAADKIRQISGKLYGMNSANAMKALADVWRSIEPGSAPKARNFALNLIGQSDIATIDVWAARMIRRAANEVAKGEYKRIPPPAETGVSGTWNAKGDAITGEFGFGASVMDKVSADLKKKGINIAPPDLQAIAWFAEKELWGTKGWTTKAGEGGSFEENIDKFPVERYIAGHSVQQGEAAPSVEAVKEAQKQVLSTLANDPSVVALRVMETKGLYGGTVEASFDTEWVAEKGQFDPINVVSDIAKASQRENQYDFFVSKVIGPLEENANARPGVEVYFRSKLDLDNVMPILSKFTARGQDGFTLAVDPRMNEGSDKYIGVRLQYVPEISMRWDEELRTILTTPDGLAAALAEKTAVLNDVVAELTTLSEVAYTARVDYDTVVVGKENYSDYISPEVTARNIASGRAVWFGQPVRAAVEAAADRYRAERRPVDQGAVEYAGEARPEGVKYSLRAPTTPEFKRWFAGSAIKNKDGSPVRMYHGTNYVDENGDPITSFRKKNGAVFLSPDPSFANKFAMNDMLWNQDSQMSAPENAHVIPVYVNAKNPFDYQNQNHINQVARILDDSRDRARFRKGAADGKWQDIEDFLDFIKQAGFDGAYISEMGRKNLAVFDSNQIKSAFAQKPTAESKDIRYSLRAPTTPEFKRWFADSKTTDESGNPQVLYTGTSKDTDFTKFRIPKNGVWLTSDRNIASQYAMENDSMGSKWIPGEGFSDINTASRVMPVYAKIVNPYRITDEDQKRINVDNYKRAQGQFFDQLRAKGYDGVDFGHGVWVVLGKPEQIKSAIGNRGTFDEKKADIRYSLRQAEKLAPIVQRNANFKRWFGNSKIVDEAGKPKVMYHGTARDITEFKPKQAGAIFVTSDPTFAEDFTEASIDYMAAEYFYKQTPEQQNKMINDAVRSLVKEGSITKEAGKQMLEGFKSPLNQRRPYDTLKQIINPIIREKLESGQNIIPVYVRAENPFDYENPEHLRQVGMQMAWDAQDRGGDANPIAWAEHFEKRAATGNWEEIERGAVQEAIRNSGFDSFYISEGGRKNLGVYEPNQVKSASGNVGTYGETGDIRYSFNGKKLDRLTKLGDERTAGQKISEAVKEAHDNFGNRSWRVSWMDASDSLGKSLRDLPIFDKDGQLRADYLTHVKFQTINTVKNGLVSGVPVVNSDGSVVIERSENNLARAKLIADQIDTNRFAVEQGMSGQQLVAEVARILRGKDILEEDKHLRALGEKQLRDATTMFKLARQKVEDGSISAKQYRAIIKKIAELRKEGYANRKMNRERLVSDDHIAFAEHIYNSVPEVREVLDIFREVNHGLVNLWEETGLLTKEKADEYRSQKHYVPFLKSAEDLDENAVHGFGMTGGKGAKSTPKMKQLKGGEHLVNIWENVSKQYAKMTALAIENQTRGVAASQLVSLGAAYETNASDPNANLRFRRDGQEISLVAENPLDVAAFQSMSYQLNPVMKAFGTATKALRWGALVNPMFWIRQLVRDPLHATLTTDAMVTPLHSASEFVGMLVGRDRKVVDILSARGVLGEFGTTMNIHDFLESVGKDTSHKPGMVGKAIHKVMQIHEAADAATRVAIYKQAYDKAIKNGMSEAQATDLAVFKARESINFAVHGNSPMLANLRQMIPFLSATITSLDTLYRAMIGHNLSGSDKAAAKRIFWSRAMMMVALSATYAMMYAGDPDYDEVPDYEKDNNFLIPVPSSTDPKKKSFIAVPTPFEVGFLFKTIPEVMVRYLNGDSTGKEMLASYKNGLIHNLPTGGVPIPQAVRPILENVTNHSFFTGNPIEGMNDQRKPVAMRGERASETAKLLSNMGLDTIGMSPAKIDNLMRGYFAEYGTFFMSLSDVAVNSIEGKVVPSKNLEDEPIIKNFMTDPNVQRSVSVFYDLENQANQTYTEFNELKKTGNAEEIHKILTDPDKKAQIIAHAPLAKIGDAMTKINNEIRRINDSTTITADQKRDLINKYKAIKADLARKGVEVAEKIGLHQ